jgi:hypothetical protein
MEVPRVATRARVAALALVGCLGVLGIVASCQPRSTAVERRSGAAAASGAPAGPGPSARDVAALAGGGGPDGAASTGDGSRAGDRTTTSASVASAGPVDDAGDGEPGEPGGGSGSPGRVAPASTADCAALEQIAIPAARIITADDFVALDQRPVGPSGSDAVAAARRVAAIVPTAARPSWVRAADAIEQAVAGGRHLDAAGWDLLRTARNEVEVWARAACPDAPPSWRCDAFGSVGPGPDVAPARAEATTALGALHRHPDTGRAIELQRTSSIVLYGWVTDAGFVTRTQQVERVDGGWATSRTHVCQGEP